MKMSSGVIRLQNVTEEKLSDARDLRQNMTSAEQILWECLRNRKCGGLKFRRQQVIEGFVADFYCEKAKLVVEADGGIHSEENQKELDEHREKVFKLRGIATIRFSNNSLINHTSDALENIESTCKQRI
jgi:very-short-patch-repair endonuclease